MEHMQGSRDNVAHVSEIDILRAKDRIHTPRTVRKYNVCKKTTTNTMESFIAGNDCWMRQYKQRNRYTKNRKRDCKNMITNTQSVLQHGIIGK